MKDVIAEIAINGTVENIDGPRRALFAALACAIVAPTVDASHGVTYWMAFLEENR
jgi:hypothetical protein